MAKSYWLIPRKENVIHDTISHYNIKQNIPYSKECIKYDPINDKAQKVGNLGIKEYSGHLWLEGKWLRRKMRRAFIKL